jgi:hypothetical protein
MNTSSRSLKVFETICQELITRLSHDATETAEAFTTQARDLLETLDSWTHEAPTPDQRAAVIAHVLDLHRIVMEYVTVEHGKHLTP